MLKPTRPSPGVLASSALRTCDNVVVYQSTYSTFSSYLFNLPRRRSSISKQSEFLLMLKPTLLSPGVLASYDSPICDSVVVYQSTYSTFSSYLFNLPCRRSSISKQNAFLLMLKPMRPSPGALASYDSPICDSVSLHLAGGRRRAAHPSPQQTIQSLWKWPPATSCSHSSTCWRTACRLLSTARDVRLH